MESDEGKLENFKGEEPNVVGVRVGTQQTLAYRLMWLFSAEVAVIGLAIITHCVTIDEAKDMALIIIGPTTSIFAIAVGFFFGQNDG